MPWPRGRKSGPRSRGGEQGNRESDTCQCRERSHQETARIATTSLACGPSHPAYSRPIQGSIGGGGQAELQLAQVRGSRRGAVVLRSEGLVVSSCGWPASSVADTAADGWPRSPRLPHEGRVVMFAHSSPCGACLLLPRARGVAPAGTWRRTVMHIEG